MYLPPLVNVLTLLNYEQNGTSEREWKPPIVVDLGIMLDYALVILLLARSLIIYTSSATNSRWTPIHTARVWKYS
jgi:hypothetical protein